MRVRTCTIGTREQHRNDWTKLNKHYTDEDITFFGYGNDGHNDVWLR
jgi:hypothetical protein